MRGLESLIPAKKQEEDQGAKDSVFLVEVEKISPSPHQPRRDFAQKELEELAASIRQYGILQPLIVSKITKDTEAGRDVAYQIIAGERRWRAAQIAKIPRVPVIIRETKEEGEKLEVSLIENIQRENLNALEEARAYKRLTEEFGLSQKEIANRVGKSRPEVTNTLRILKLPANILASLARNEINSGHTRPLLSLTRPQEQEKLFQEILSHNLNVHDAEVRAQEISRIQEMPRGGKQKGGRALSNDPQTEELVEELKAHIGVGDVRVKTKGRRARLAIGFPSKKNLHEFIRGVLQ